MSESWPPGDYSAPAEYDRNDYFAILIAVVVGLAAATITLPSIQNAAGLLIKDWVRIAQIMGAGPLALIAGAHFGWISWILILSTLMIVLHESVHFAIASLLGMDPSFEWDEFTVLKNPSVVIVGDGIKRWENLLALSGPFVLINTLCLIIMGATEAVVGGSAAYILLVNSAASGLDLYHILRLLSMPKGTQYSNFREGGDIKTKYAFPKE